MASQQAALSMGLQSLRQRGSYTDFTIVAEKEFPCHRVVLAAVSPYFETLFNSGLEEVQCNSVELPMFSANGMELILRYIYGGDDVITSDSAAVLYHAANYLQINTLTQQCEAFLESGMPGEISLDIWQIAKLFEKNHIAEVAKTIALKNFEIFCHTDLIGRISLQHLKDILAEPFVNCSGTMKCKTAWVWLISQPCISEEDAHSLIGALVKSSSVAPDHILGAKTNCEDIKDEVDEIGCDVLHERERLWKTAIDKHWIKPEGAANTQMINVGKLGGNRSSEWLVVVGGTDIERSKLTLLNFKEKEWFTIEGPVDTDLGHRYAVSSLGSVLYLTGGTKQRRFMYFAIEQKNWQHLPDLHFGRELHSMVTVGNEMFIIGGASKDEVEARDIYKWTTGNGEWSLCGDIAYPVVSANAAVVGTKLFLIGGCRVSNGKPGTAPSDIVQCFETTTGLSYKIKYSLPVKTKAHTTAVAVVDKDIFVIHKANVYRIGEKFEPFELHPLPRAPVKGFAAVAFGDKILVFGGEDENFMGSNQILQYDTACNECVKLPMTTPFNMCNFVYTNIMVPTSWDLTPA